MRSSLLLPLSLLLSTSAALNVAVAGATGRVGRLVVQSLLREGHAVTALIRDSDKAKDVLPAVSEMLSIRELDIAIADGAAVGAACEGTERMIWCATGFSEDGESVDLLAMDKVPAAFSGSNGDTPVIIMLSSAGVTRPAWDDAKKERLIGAADIPIIRLNPGGILGKKCEAEDLLRKSGVPCAKTQRYKPRGPSCARSHLILIHFK